MFKYAFLLANLMSVFFVSSVMDDGVIIEDNTPLSLRPGESRIVEISVNKGDVEGFAKLQLDLPDGLIAEAVDTHGASFTFSAQKVKFIWMSLPDEQVFSVSYKLTATANARGNKVISGAFSYIKANQRVDYELQTKMVEISDEALADTPAESNGNFSCTRSITDMGDGSYLVQVQVKNATNTGFVKIREEIPAGFNAMEKESSGAIFTNDSGSLKWVWFDAPTSSNYQVAYRLSGGMQDPALSGTLSYVENNTPREMSISTEGDIVRATGSDTASIEPTEELNEPDESENLASETSEEPEIETETEVDPTEVNAIEEPVAEQRNEVTEEGTESSEENVTADTRQDTAIPDAEKSVTYKVQIAAAHRVVDEKYFQSRHGFSEGFSIENHEGWVKYTTGSFPVYKNARDDRERIRNRYNFRGPFVTAYNNGERITVQEALMITRQQWYQ